MAALCVPAREVGGDYYDFFALGPRRLGLLVADVAGKGTSAALYMAELKGLMLSLSQIHESPRHLLIEVNRIIAANLDSRSFITMTYAVVDLERRTLTYARAGHTPLIHRTVASPAQARLVAPSGMVVGLQLDGLEHRFAELLEEVTVPLVDGDVFLLYTDGLSEAMNAEGDLFGEERLRMLVEEHGGLGSDGLRERIVRDVEAHVAGADPHDDMTLIVVTVDGAAAVRPRRRRHDRAGRRLPHALRRRGLDRPRPARGARLRGDGLARERVGDRPVADERRRRHRGGGAGGRRRRGAAPGREPARPAGHARRRAEPRRRRSPALEARIGHRFVDRTLLEHALTHRSRAHEDVTGGVVDNESLEFLGDAVVGLVIAEALYREYPDLDEGAKSKIRASLVSAGRLARLGEALGLGEHLLLGRGEEKTGGRRKTALLADACEAIVAAIYLDAGLEAAAQFVRRELWEPFKAGWRRLRRGRRRAPSTTSRRCRSACRRAGSGLPEYRVAGERGPEHDKVFEVEVRVNGDVAATATGRSKKDAEQQAAQRALQAFA